MLAGGAGGTAQRSGVEPPWHDRLPEREARSALTHFDRARDTAPRNTEFRGNRAVVLQGLRRFAEAEAELREVLRLNPAYSEAHNNPGNLLLGAGRSAEAAASAIGERRC